MRSGGPAGEPGLAGAGGLVATSGCHSWSSLQRCGAATTCAGGPEGEVGPNISRLLALGKLGCWQETP